MARFSSEFLVKNLETFKKYIDERDGFSLFSRLRLLLSETFF